MAGTITEQFNKSRNLSITISIICFVISNIPSDKFEKLSLFGVDLSQLNARFIVYSLALASIVSIISLFLTFNNDVLDNVKLKNRDITSEMITAEMRLVIGKCENVIRSSTSELEKYLSSDLLNSYLKDCVPLVDDIRLSEQVDAIINDGEIERAVSDLKKTIFDNVPFDTSSTQYHDFANISFPRVAEMITYKMGSLRANMWVMQPPEYAYTARRLSDIVTQQLMIAGDLIPSLNRLSVEVAKQRRALKRESIYLNTEAVIFGLGVPLLLFVISIYHAGIRICGLDLIKLPELFG